MPDRIRPVLRAHLSLVVLLLLSGCNVVGALASRVAPAPMIPAAFPLPAKPTVIVVENYHNPASLRLESDAMARAVAIQLTDHGVGPIIDPGKLENLRQRDTTAYRSMPLDAIARAVGAEQVIYVNLERLELVEHLASEAPGGEAEARVRVVDAETGDALWPLDAAGGQSVTVSIDPQRVTADAPNGAVERMLHDALAVEIGKLFHDWQGESVDGAAEQFDEL
jgi:hypothetical protein